MYYRFIFCCNVTLISWPYCIKNDCCNFVLGILIWCQQRRYHCYISCPYAMVGPNCDNTSNQKERSFHRSKVLQLLYLPSQRQAINPRTPDHSGVESTPGVLGLALHKFQPQNIVSKSHNMKFWPLGCIISLKNSKESIA